MDVDKHYIYPAVTVSDVKAVKRVCREIKRQPPILIKFLSETFNGGYEVEQLDEVNWRVLTTYQHILITAETDHRARLRSWGRRQDRRLYEIAVAPLPEAGATSPRNNPEDWRGAAGACPAGSSAGAYPAIDRVIECKRG